MPELCNYDQPWAGPCKNIKGKCKNHDDKKCHCGKPATRGCAQMTAMTCGTPTCNDCECNMKHS